MALIINNLSKSFDDNIVFKNFNLTIKPNEIVLLSGKSGIGKSTLLRIINNLESADDGEIFIDDICLSKSLDNKAKYVSKKDKLKYMKKIGLVFQDFALFNNLCVIDNLIEPIYKDKNARKKALELLDLVDLSEKANSKINTLSGGEKQRVAIARTLMLDQQYICFDEPTSSLDKETTNSIINLIKKLADKGMGVLVVSHDIDFQNKVATRKINANTFISG